MTTTMDEQNVVLLHGLSRSSKIMDSFASFLKMNGFTPFNIDYPSMKKDIDQLTEYVHKQIKFLYKRDTPLHFIGHSLGAIIIRKLLDRYPPPNLGRVVMIAPPNHGTQVVDFLKNLPFFSSIYGPSFLQLGANSTGIWPELPKPNYEFGIISGTKGNGFILSKFIVPKPNDGKVSVASTELEGAKDNLHIALGHAELPQNPNVMREAVHFITEGTFYQ